MCNKYGKHKLNFFLGGGGAQLLFYFYCIFYILEGVLTI